MSSILYREITPYCGSVDRWNNVTINAGAAQSTLQDIKIPEGAGSFTYHNSGDLSSGCSNRFLYWRTNHDVIEIVEISLDVNLRSNHLRLRFQNTPILPGISVHENLDDVVILIATVSAIHKLSFPHPRRLERDAPNVKKRDASAPSIFHDTTEEALRTRSRYFVLNNVTVGNPLPHTSCSWLDKDGNAVFLLANNAGSVLMLVLTDRHGVEVTRELVKSGSLFRIFTGFVPSVLKGNKVPVVLSILCHQLPSDVLVYLLFNDLQLRIWSFKRQDYVYADSVLSFDAQKCLSAGNFSANLCQLRKSGSASPVYLGVFVPVLSQKLIYIFKQIQSQDHPKLELVNVLHHTEHDLVDFCIGNHYVWTLWLSSDNQPVILTSLIDPSMRDDLNACWIPVDLEPRVSRSMDLKDANLQETYMKEIFKAGRFLPATISKAVSIYNSMKNLNYSMSISMKADDLKAKVIEAIENEIHLRAGDFDPSEKEYLEMVVDCWDRFFSYCIQYHEVGMKPLGMVCDDNTGCVVVIKKSYYSLLCPCDSMQYIVSPELRQTSLNPDDLDPKLYRNVKSILSCIDVIHENIDENLLCRFEDKIYNKYSPIKYASEIVTSINLRTDSNIMAMLSVLPSKPEIVASLDHLITELDLTDNTKSANEDYIKHPAFASSMSGVGALCSGLSHFARQRFEFCRDLLIFEVVLWGLDSMESDEIDSLIMQSSIIPRTVSLVRSYFIILWCTYCDCIPVTVSMQDTAFKQFSLLELPEFIDKDLTNITRENTINHLFFQEDGGVKARKVITMKRADVTDNWVSLFPSLVMECASLLWPLEESSFPEFLFSQCQFIPLQEYDHLLQDWCTWNKQYLNFLVGTSHLIMNEPSKALKLFLDTAKELDSESLLSQRILKSRQNSDASLISMFCMKIVKMFEQFSLSDCIVKLVSTIINQIEESDPLVPIFHSVLFKHHLNLGEVEEAFSTLTKNPDSSRRKDCLRQLIVYLCERKQFQKIIELSFLAYEDEVISILESRARCSDLSKNTSFYGILYALHIHHKKFRKAAAVMYEQAMRFGKEVISLTGLSKQVSCYLTAINCLYLAEPQYAWIVKPVMSFEENPTSGDEMDCRNSPKRDVDGEEILNPSRPVKVEVLGVEDVRREYNLAQARLQHAKKHQSVSNLAITPLSPEETVALLLNASLFDAAINLSKSFSLSFVPVFEALAYKCLSSTFQSETFSSSDTERDVLNKTAMQDNYTSNSSSKNLWSMLQKFLSDYESDGKSELHRCVTEKFLFHGANLPAWLRLSYQKRNFTELIHLYISHGLLENALSLMIKYIKAVMGIHKEDFDLEFSLHCSSPAVWLPYSYIDLLVNAAEDLQEQEPFKLLYQEMEDTLQKYNQTVESITASKAAQRSE